MGTLTAVGAAWVLSGSVHEAIQLQGALDKLGNDNYPYA